MLLNLIDHLPSNCYYSQAVANDEEHARMLLEAQEARQSEDGKSDEKWSPPSSTWSTEAGVLADLIDEVKLLRSTLIQVNSSGKSQPPKLEPYPRPRTALDKLRRRRAREQRQAAHEALVARVLRR